MVAKQSLNGRALRPVTDSSGSRVCAYVLNIGRLNFCILNRIAHGAQSAVSVARHASEVIGISGRGITDDLSQDIRAALLGMFHLFQHQNSGAFTDDKPIPVLVPRTG